MSLEKAKKYLEEKGYADHVIELEESSADGTACSRSSRCRAGNDRKDDVISG